MSDFALTSAAFQPGEPIPAATPASERTSRPVSLVVAAGRDALARVDRGGPLRPVGTFTHWLAWGIHADARGLAEGQALPVEGRNDFGTTGYRGPCPPRGYRPHRYVFRLFALPVPLELRADAGKADVERAARAHTLAVAELVGTYKR
jgi:Raf kinase inhibitor-like YbhB/YbcL family protein